MKRIEINYEKETVTTFFADGGYEKIECKNGAGNLHREKDNAISVAVVTALDFNIVYFHDDETFVNQVRIQPLAGVDKENFLKDISK